MKTLFEYMEALVMLFIIGNKKPPKWVVFVVWIVIFVAWAVYWFYIFTD